jgi:hypothetical protein
MNLRFDEQRALGRKTRNRQMTRTRVVIAILEALIALAFAFAIVFTVHVIRAHAQQGTCRSLCRNSRDIRQSYVWLRVGSLNHAKTGKSHCRNQIRCEHSDEQSKAHRDRRPCFITSRAE